MLKLDIQRFADGKVVIDTQLNTRDFENGLDKMKNTASNAGSTIKNIVAGLGITKMITTAISTINASIDGAVARFDTLNNFPKVMSNLGIGAEDAEESISKMSEKLAGLPTTLDEGALAVQRFTSANSDVEKSTDIFLALNNAILAGGASSEIQSSALEQLSQAYAKGKPDMMEWRTAMTAMPAQLKQVATAMGYVDASQLGEDLREGTVSMDEFMDTIVQLNNEGLEGFSNFETQARNATGGIATSIKVAKTQVVKGVTDIIDALNVKLENLGIGKISDIIAKFGKDVKIGLDQIAKLISGEISAVDFGKSIMDMLTNFVSKINENAPMIISTGMKLISDLIIGLAQGLPTLIPQVIDTLLTIVDSLIDNIDLIIDAGIELIIGLTEGIINAIPILIEKVPDIIIKLIDKLTDPEMIGKIWKAASRLLVELGVGLIKAIPKLFEGIDKVKGKIIEEIGKLPGKMLEVGRKIVEGLWNGLKNSVGWLTDKISGWAGGVLDSVKGFFGIHSPSRLFRDEIGKNLVLGIGEGFEDELDNVYRDMQRAINFEQDKLQASVETGRVFNTLQNSTPIQIIIDANVEMDSQKVGRLVTPSVTRTIKNGGGV